MSPPPFISSPTGPESSFSQGRCRIELLADYYCSSSFQPVSYEKVTTVRSSKQKWHLLKESTKREPQTFRIGRNIRDNFSLLIGKLGPRGVICLWIPRTFVAESGLEFRSLEPVSVIFQISKNYIKLDLFRRYVEKECLRLHWWEEGNIIVTNN